MQKLKRKIGEVTDYDPRRGLATTELEDGSTMCFSSTVFVGAGRLPEVKDRVTLRIEGSRVTSARLSNKIPVPERII